MGVSAKFVEELTTGRIKLGSGTVYTTLMKMKNDNIISLYSDGDRKTLYEITSMGKALIRKEIERIKHLNINAMTQEEYFND